MNNTKIIAKNKKELKALTQEYRENGYMIITYWDTLIELEKGSELITIEVKGR